MNELDKVISIAKQEEGYLEKKSNKDLDDKIKNAGANNYTKYARDLDNIKNFYNWKKQGFAWCDVFVDWCFVQAFGVDRARELLCQPLNSCGAGVGFSANYYKNKNQYYKSNPKAGDQIFFKNANGSATHTGLVYQVDNKYVYTIEGNTSSEAGVIANGGCVRLKKYLLSYKYIMGYGRPNYKYEEKKPIHYNGLFPTLPSRTYFKKGDKGIQVMYLQKFLNWSINAGLVEDGIIGNLTTNAVKKFQKAVGIKQDGLFGKNSLAKAKAFTK